MKPIRVEKTMNEVITDLVSNYNSSNPLNLPLFIARRLYFSHGDKKNVSRPAIHIATLGVTIGLAIMIITVSVVLGFKHTIRDKMVGFGCHIQVENLFVAGSMADINDTIAHEIQNAAGVAHLQRYIMTKGVLKTDGDFMGVVFKGIGQEYKTDFLKEHLIEGEIPLFTNQKSTNEVLLSQYIVAKLHLKVGERVFAYFIDGENVRVRRFTVKGVYKTNMTQFDQTICFTDIYTVRKLNGWEERLYSGAEIEVCDFNQVNSVADDIAQKIRFSNVDVAQPEYAIQSKTIYETYPQIFSWLELLDIHVWIIMILMICVAGLLIIILERTQMIGILKALGARSSMVRHAFLWFAVFIVGKGLLWGNAIGIGLVLLQQYTGIVKLDAETYYVNTAPMELNVPLVIAINIVTLFICISVLIIPSFLVSFIHPAKSMRYE